MQQIDCLRPSIGNVIDFLTGLFTEQNLSYSSLNTARSALSTTVLVDNIPVGRHPMVVRFMRGVFNLRPSMTRYKVTWDVSVVLEYLCTLFPLSSLTLKYLSLKLVMLIALTSAQRLQTLQMLKINLMNQFESCFVFSFDCPLKHSRPKKGIKPLELKAYQADERLCVYKVLVEYLQRTEQLRGSENQLLISHQKPYKKVSRDTIGRWIKTTMGLAGIDLERFKAHSTRSASTSAAQRALVPVQDILDKAGWSSERTFATYYNRPIQQGDQFQNAVLTLSK